MKIRLYILVLCHVLIVSCEDEKKSIDANETESNNQQSNITEKAIKDFNYTDYALSSAAEKEVANWEKYQELAIQISYLKKTDLSFFNGDKELLKKFIDEFKLGLPERLRVNSITSRTTVIETTILKLNENLTLDNIDANLKLSTIKEVVTAFSNLNYQINKKLERDVYDKIQPE